MSTAVVTGGASGIGAATARRLAGEGYRVVVADVQDGPGSEVAGEIGGRYAHLDVGDPDAWVSFASELAAGEGGVDLAHLNAGVTTGEADLTAMTDAQYRRVMSANLDGVVFGVRALVPLMAGRPGAAIVATASVAGLIGFAPDPVYTATKHAVVGLVRALGPSLDAAGVSIDCVCPGLVDTPLIGGAREAIAALGLSLIDPDDIAAGVWAAATSGRTGEAWVCLPGRPPEPHAFADPVFP